MGFWNALSVLGPIAPAQAEAQEIRRQRDIQNQEAQQDAALRKVQIQGEQQKIARGNQPIPIGEPKWNASKGSYTVTSLNPQTGRFEETPVPGESPEHEASSRLGWARNLAKQTLGDKANDQDVNSLTYALAGLTVKPAAGSADERARQDYAADPDPNKGSFEEWKAKQATAGRVAANPPKVNRDDRAIAIKQKQQLGQQLTPEEQAYLGAYNAWTKETKIDPGIARAVAFGANRYLPVIDPNDPEKVTFMRAGDAARQGAGSPASIAFQTDKALTRAFTSGQPAQTINYFNTATEHLKQLQQAADALNNGDLQLFNRLANSWATNTGNPAPTNFATIRNAVAGELSKTFKGAAATDAEIDAINTSINSSQSPAQLSGAIQNNIRLMGSKMEALRGQYEQGKRGQPNFPGQSEIPSKTSGDPKVDQFLKSF
jgi:hypothetical protein